MGRVDGRAHRNSIRATESLLTDYGVAGMGGAGRGQQCDVTTESRAGGMEDHFSWKPMLRRCYEARGLRPRGWWGGSGRGDSHSRYKNS